MINSKEYGDTKHRLLVIAAFLDRIETAELTAFLEGIPLWEPASTTAALRHYISMIEAAKPAAAALRQAEAERRNLV